VIVYFVEDDDDAGLGDEPLVPVPQLAINMASPQQALHFQTSVRFCGVTTTTPAIRRGIPMLTSGLASSGRNADAEAAEVDMTRLAVAGLKLPTVTGVGETVQVAGSGSTAQVSTTWLVAFPVNVSVYATCWPGAAVFDAGETESENPDDPAETGPRRRMGLAPMVTVLWYWC